MESATLTDASDRLLELGLIAPDPSAASSHEPAAAGPDATLTYELTAAGHSTLERLTSTGEERLTDLLECWRPDQHADLARLIANLAHEFFIDDSALRERHPGARDGSRFLSGETSAENDASTNPARCAQRLRGP